MIVKFGGKEITNLFLRKTIAILVFIFAMVFSVLLFVINSLYFSLTNRNLKFLEITFK